MGDMAIMDILLFAAVAAFLILRLRSILGRRTGAEDSERWRARPPERTLDRADKVSDNVTPFPGANRPTIDVTPGEVEAPVAGDPVLQRGFDEIRRADPSFAPAEFAQGARGAFEMIVASFAQGDTDTLKPLLAPEVYEGFARAIRERVAAKNTLETTLVGIRSADIVAASMQGRFANVTVKFVSEQVIATRDADGKVIDGDATKVNVLTDQWTFARDTRSRDPNWALVRTEEPS
ncbi:MAG: Tim44/TimA family putative adaptor protein [Alphaproteobacteria bacterium]|nr:Tim44/TimA family putative adaptor protein [Alphaproteobacteria bacterium]